MKLFLSFFFCSFWLWAQDTTASHALPAHPSPAGTSSGDTLLVLPRDTVLTGQRSSSREIKIFGDHTIPAGTVYTDDLRIIGGSLTIEGTLEGHATVIGGNVDIRPGAVVNGDILALGGTIEKSPQATIRGKLIETNLTEGLVYRETDSRRDSSDHREWEFTYDTDPSECGRHHDNWIHARRDPLRYNRNEGLVLIPFNRQWDRQGESSFRLNLSAGYRFGDHSLVGRLTFQKTFFRNRNLILYTSLFNDSRSDDDIRLTETENSLANLFGRQDFKDRWNEDGWLAGVGLALGPLRVSYDFRSVYRDTLGVIDIWSVGNRRRPLRPPLRFQPRQVSYFLLQSEFRTPHYRMLRSGIASQLRVEFFDPRRTDTELLQANPLDLNARIQWVLSTNWEFTSGILWRSRLVVGTTQGDLPEYRYFGVGGLGSVSAHPFKQQTGDEMVQAALALVFLPDFLDGDTFLSLFLETGHAWRDSWTDYRIQDVSAYQQDLLSAAGIEVGAVDGRDVDLSFSVAKALDSDQPLETTVRLTLNF
ncbi:MAG: hypothetical protein D6762_06645 [Candidatus Neomarinimicrobiota bacterium]|nr:MAG: hypothetical protein D6762_06645 [Candidatus Neomarinimicrobiota bacterium]